MRFAPWLMVLLGLGMIPSSLQAHPLRFPIEWRRTNRNLRGRLLDYTNNHGADRRLYSCALGQKRDMYVYLPPCYDPSKRYPFLLYLHGYAQDEFSFLAEVAEVFDDAIVRGIIPPMVIAAPDGSLPGHSCGFPPSSFFLDTPKGGNFEQFLMGEVWDFVMTNFSIRPEREAHVIAGLSMGGGAAYNKAFKYKHRFKTVVGIYPPLNIRYENCRGRGLANFNPRCWGWRENFDRPWPPVGRIYRVMRLHQRRFINPLFGRRSGDVARFLSRENPIEMLDSRDVRPGDFNMFVGYGGMDEFNIDAQVESFLYRARQRGLCIEVDYRRWGRHNRPTARKILPHMLSWLGCQLRGYGPVPACVPGGFVEIPLGK